MSLEQGRAIAAYQQQLLERAQYVFHATPLSAATCAAFLAVPRHRFVPRYRVWGSTEWHEVTSASLEQHLARLYVDEPLILAGDDDENPSSTISQPSLVLRMLDLLQLEPGQTVFELGTGSGWNAALMAYIVGPEGRVYSVELLPEVAQQAQRALDALPVTNARIITGDGSDAYLPGAPYDRAVFTAGAYDVPRAFYARLRDGGRLLLVLKQAGGGDVLCLLRKVGERFVSETLAPCGFLALRGKHQHPELEPQPIERFPEWPALQGAECGRTAFWWAGKGGWQFEWRTLAVRFFLAIADPGYRAFTTEKTHPRDQVQQYFGLWDASARSLVIAKDDALVAYGTPAARGRLVRRLHEWVDLGMPSAASFRLTVYPADATVQPASREWIVKRTDSQFVWHLDA